VASEWLYTCPEIVLDRLLHGSGWHTCSISQTVTHLHISNFAGLYTCLDDVLDRLLHRRKALGHIRRPAA